MLVIAIAVAVLLLLDGAGRASAATDVCSYSFPHPKQVTSKIHFGKKTIYNRDDSDQLVCSGAFGAPDGAQLSDGAKCDIIASVYGLANPADSWIGSTNCALVTLSTGGGVRGVAEDALCGYLADVFGVGTGLFSAGATGNPAIGVAVWKGVTFFGNTAVCVGLADGGAKTWGEQHEAAHEVSVGRDVTTKGRCLQLTQQRILGVSRLNWSAIKCPKGFMNNGPSPFASKPPPILDPRAIGPNSIGFGDVAPKEIYLGGDPTGLVCRIHWGSWGGPTASGYGTGWYISGDQTVNEGHWAVTHVVASDLGPWDGKPAYLNVTWTYPDQGKRPAPRCPL